MKDLSLKTVNSAIRSYFNFLNENKYIRNNPVEGLKILKDRKQVVQTFSAEQLDNK
ncbi:hypothetical protein [Thalassobacillus cyri]|uniref:hypothetical protein n=1 Tax=Thalassobacillus cyri TaxID=571932 RepID=UPI001C40A661|nr:hypothetical protein [Thalassobacillus cyri]